MPGSEPEASEPSEPSSGQSSAGPTIRIADWATMIAAHPSYADDMLHLTPAGRLAISQLIARTVGPAPS